MFFSENIQLIDKSDEELTKFLTDEGLNFKIIDDSSRYCAWGIYEGYINLGLTLNESLSLGYIISLFYSGMGISCGTDYLYKEKTIEHDLIDKFEELDNVNNEQVKAELFYDEICDLYTHNIDKYAYHRERLNIMISGDTLERFRDVYGKTLNEKLVNLIKNYRN